MEFFIKHLPLFLILHVTTSSYMQILNPGDFLRPTRYAKLTNNIPNIYAIPASNPFLPDFASPGISLRQLPFLSNPQAQSNEHSRRKNPEENDPQGDSGYIQPQEIVKGYLRPVSEKPKEHQLLDNIIKDRVSALQVFKDAINKLLEDIANTAMSFLSKSSFFGTATRKSLLDPSNLEDIKTMKADLSDVGKAIRQIYKNLLADVDSCIHYLSDLRNFSLKTLFSNAFTVALRVFSYQ